MTKSASKLAIAGACKRCGIKPTPKAVRNLTNLAQRFADHWAGDEEQLMSETVVAVAALKDPQAKAESEDICELLGRRDVAATVDEFHRGWDGLVISGREKLHFIVRFIDALVLRRAA